MRRRTLIASLGVAAAWPTVGRAEAKVPVVGFLFGGSATLVKPNLPNLIAGLGEQGYREGQNLAIEVRTAEGVYERLPELLAETVAHKVDVIVAAASRAALAVKAAAPAVPIVFTIAADPIALGLVTSLNRPGGNITGTTFLSIELTGKQVELLRDLVPNARTVGFLISPEAPDAAAQISRAEAAARQLGLALEVVTARTRSEFEPAFATLVERHAGAVLIGGDEYLTSEAPRLIALATRYALPAVGGLRPFAVLGALASYGASVTEALRQAGNYVGRILNGAKPADLPVVQVSKFELVINMRTAKALGLTVPTMVLAGATELIE